MAFKFPNKNIGAIQKATSTLPIQPTSTAPINPMKPISAKASAVNTGMTGTPPKKILTTEELFGTSTPKKVLTTEELFGEKPTEQTVWTEKPLQAKVEPIADFLGVKNLAKGLAQTIFFKTKSGKQLLADLEKGSITPEQFDDIIGMGMEEKGIVKPHQVLASAGQTALTIASAGQYNPTAQTGVLTKALPTTLLPSKLSTTKLGEYATKGKGLIPSILRTGITATKAAPTGAIYGGLKALGEGKSSEDIKKEAISGAKSSALFAGILQGGGEAISSLKGLGDRLMGSLIKPTKGQFAYGKNPSGELAKRKIIGNSLEELYNNTTNELKKVGEEIGNSYEANKGVLVNGDDFLNPLQETLNKLNKSPKVNSSAIKRINDIQDDLMLQPEVQKILKGEKINIKELNNLKAYLQEITKWTGNQSDDKLVNEGLQKTYSWASKTAENIASNQNLKQLNQSYSSLIAAKDAINKQIDIENRKNLIGLAIGAGGGGAILYQLGQGDYEGAGKTLMLSGGAMALSSPAVKTRLAGWFANLPEAEKIKFAQQSPKAWLIIKRVLDTK